MPQRSYGPISPLFERIQRASDPSNGKDDVRRASPLTMTKRISHRIELGLSRRDPQSTLFSRAVWSGGAARAFLLAPTSVLQGASAMGGSAVTRRRVTRRAPRSREVNATRGRLPSELILRSRTPDFGTIDRRHVVRLAHVSRAFVQSASGACAYAPNHRRHRRATHHDARRCRRCPLQNGSHAPVRGAATVHEVHG